MDLKGVMLSEISLMENNKYYVYFFFNTNTSNYQQENSKKEEFSHIALEVGSMRAKTFALHPNPTPHSIVNI